VPMLGSMARPSASALSYHLHSGAARATCTSASRMPWRWYADLASHHFSSL
jgi:hypothetical protein